MTEEELLSKIQACTDETAKRFIRPARMSIINVEETSYGQRVLAIGSDMPVLVYRVFDVDTNGNVTEVGEIEKAVEATRHYNVDIKPSLKNIPVAAAESTEYEIVVENQIEENNAVEVSLKSSMGRDIKMIEVYRYFDYVSKIFFVSCIGLSFGGQYLFSVTPDSKHLRLVVGNDQLIRSRVDMMTELLQARLLPSYRTIHDAAVILSGKAARAQLKLNNPDGGEVVFYSTFCYDDPETETRFGFFAKDGNEKEGIIVVVDTVENNKIILSNGWTDAQKAAVDKFKALMKDNPEEFNKHTCSFFVDNLDYRYKAFKEGRLKPRLPINPNETPADSAASDATPAVEEKTE